MILYGSSLSPFVRKVMVYAAEKGIPLDNAQIGRPDPQPEFLRASPLKKMPAFVDGDFSIADCAAAPALFYSDWLHAIPDGALKAYRTRVLARPSVARVVDEARPYRSLFPLGVPDRD